MNSILHCSCRDEIVKLHNNIIIICVLQLREVVTWPSGYTSWPRNAGLRGSNLSINNFWDKYVYIYIIIICVREHNQEVPWPIGFRGASAGLGAGVRIFGTQVNFYILLLFVSENITKKSLGRLVSGAPAQG